MSILILVAIEDELKREDLPDHQIEYIGVGKVNAAINTLNAIQKHNPKKIINFGKIFMMCFQKFSILRFIFWQIMIY